MTASEQSIAREAGKEQKGIAGKLQHARELYLGGGVKANEDGSFTVRSWSNSNTSHTVSPDTNSCDCAGFAYNAGYCTHCFCAAIALQLPTGYSIERKYGRFGYVYALTGPGGERRGLHLSLGEAIDFSHELVREEATDG